MHISFLNSDGHPIGGTYRTAGATARAHAQRPWHAGAPHTVYQEGARRGPEPHGAHHEAPPGSAFADGADPAGQQMSGTCHTAPLGARA